MLKTLLSATAASALMLSTAFAQTNVTPTDPATPPAATTTAPVTPSATPPMPSDTTAAKPAGTAMPNFVASQQPDQMLASKFKGANVLGPNNEKVGDVNDVLFDKNGKVLALVIGVGGFLGIGEKDVGIDMASFQIVPATTGSATGTAATTASTTDDPNNVKLKIAMTKDELKTAPTFQRYKAPSTASTGTSGNTGMAPRRGSTAPATSR